nr:transposase [Candidatus Desulfatibia profunda]
DFAGNELPVPIAFEVIERSIKKGQTLIFPEIEVNTYWTTLDLDANDTIFLYQDHGTSEQFHSEIKTDMDLERLPSKFFESNAVILLLGMLAYNLLRLCGQESLREDNGNIEKIPGHRKKAHRRRIRTVILDLIYMAGKIIHTGRQWFISFGRINPWRSIWDSIYQRFVADTA